jgi:hypothetical protein
MMAGHTFATQRESEITDGNFIVLEPSRWVGGNFPLSDEISPALDVSKGNWIILLYHPDCPKCRDAITSYERLAANVSQRYRVALIAISPGLNRDSLSREAVHRQLDHKKQWLAKTPVEIQVIDGTVVATSLDLPSATTFEKNDDSLAAARGIDDL